MPDDRGITVVTGFSKDGYEQYGRRFIETFTRHAPDNLGLVAYVAEPIPIPATLWPRGRYVLHSELDGVQEFVERNKNIPAHCGREPVRGWRHKDERVGYSYRFDAVRFCWQLFYPEHAAHSLPDGHVLVWFDGDVVFHDAINTNFILHSLAKHDLAYLGRRTHTELGFWAIRLNVTTRNFLRNLTIPYRTDRIFADIPEWHSAVVFDWTLARSGVSANNLTRDDAGNVWERTELRRFSTHLKGKLKEGIAVK